MPSGIFSTYSTDENRVTASILAVLQSLSLQRMQRILGELLEDPDLSLVTFRNQPSKDEAGVPDAIISGRFRIAIETKIKRNAVRREQLERHLQAFTDTAAKEVLLVLTPDAIVPSAIADLADSIVAWVPFARLDQAIDELLDDSREVVSEREAFLLRELQVMLVNEGLVASDLDVVVVAARNAWPEYLGFHAYVCQPDRSFQPTKHMAFYSNGKIHCSVPRIQAIHDRVLFRPGGNKGKLGELIASLLKGGSRQAGEEFKVMLLSPPDSSQTITLGAEVENDLKTENGRNWAFTLSQRYVSLDGLKRAKTTSELVAYDE